MEEELFDEVDVVDDDAARLLPRASVPRARGLPVAAGLLAFSLVVYVGDRGFFGREDGELLRLALHSEGAALSFEACAQYDDDAFYPADPIGGETCFQQDVATSCFMHDLPQYAALASNCAGTCGADAWSNLCSWQAIRALPETCAGAFAQSPPDPARHGGRNRGPRSPDGQVDYDDDGAVSPYCDAVVRFYAAAHGMDKVWKTGVYFWRATDLDFWCADATRRALADFAAGDGSEPIELRLLALAPEALKQEPHDPYWVPSGDEGAAPQRRP